MSDQSFETEPHGFCIGHCATGFLRVAKGDLINPERLLHTSKTTIYIQRYEPYPVGLSANGTLHGVSPIGGSLGGVFAISDTHFTLNFH